MLKVDRSFMKKVAESRPAVAANYIERCDRIDAYYAESVSHRERAYNLRGGTVSPFTEVAIREMAELESRIADDLLKLATIETTMLAMMIRSISRKTSSSSEPSP